MMTKANVFPLKIDAIGRKRPDEELVRSILAGDKAEMEVLMSRHNRRLYRVCRSVVTNDAEAEAALQETYLRAYRNLGRFPGDSKFVTWLTKIAIYEALRRLRPQLVSKQRDGKEQLMAPDSARLLVEAIDSLPSNYRTVFVLRDLEKLSADETAACLLLSPEAVETRLMRSRRMLQQRLRPHVLDQPAEHVYKFERARWAGLMERVAAGVAQYAGQKVMAP
jgi:RNA polymerase sigma-70 factor (ECF subfamily)